MKRLVSVVVAILLISTCFSALAEGDKSIVREESLVVFWGQWGVVSSYNPLSSSANCSVIGGGNELTYESLFMYNMLTNEIEPLLATGYEWTADNQITVKLNPAAHWNDGEPFTAADVAYTFNLGNHYDLSWSSHWTYLESVEAVDDYTVVFALKADPFNTKDIIGALATTMMLPEHVWQAREDEAGGDITALREIFNESFVSTGPFLYYFNDETKVVVVRDDNYWGQDASMFGKLTPVKYFVIPIYNSNDVGNLDLANGDVDVSQSFIADVWELWADGQPIRCYLDELPYYLPGSMPSLIFNVTRPGLSDPVVRKAIALCIDYGMVADMAMCGYTDDIVPSLLLLNTVEAQYEDQTNEALLALRWDTTDVEGNVEKANAMLDEAGYMDVNSDGWREMPDGSPIEWKVECPYGWTDWNASLEITAQSAEEIGLKLTTYFPESPVWNNDMQTGDFDIVMNTPSGSAAAQPWSRAYTIMYSGNCAPIGEVTYSDYGRYSNARADELINLIAATDDMEKLAAYYTELDTIFLADLPTVPLMYRPLHFYTVNSTHWTGYPVEGDGSNVPPNCLIYGASVRSLYMIEPVAK